MKTVLFIATLLLFNTSGSKVYICDSPSATKYHLSRNCRGLNNCKHKIVEIQLSEAKAQGRELCGWED